MNLKQAKRMRKHIKSVFPQNAPERVYVETNEHQKTFVYPPGTKIIAPKESEAARIHNVASPYDEAPTMFDVDMSTVVLDDRCTRKWYKRLKRDMKLYQRYGIVPKAPEVPEVAT